MTVSSVSGIYYLKSPKVTLAPGELWKMPVTFLYLKNHMCPLYLHFPSSSFSFFFSLFWTAYNKKLWQAPQTQSKASKGRVLKNLKLPRIPKLPCFTVLSIVWSGVWFMASTIYIKLASQLKSELWDTVNWARKWLVDFDTEKI